jgi:argininosuccinate lyase
MPYGIVWVKMDGLTLDELREFSSAFEQDFFAAITLESTLDCHNVPGGTARNRVRESLSIAQNAGKAAREVEHADT